MSINHTPNNSPAILLHATFTLGRFQFEFERHYQRDLGEQQARLAAIRDGTAPGNEELSQKKLEELEAFHRMGAELIEAGMQKQSLQRSIMSLPEFAAFAREYLADHAELEQEEAFAYIMRNYLAEFQGRKIAEKERGFRNLDEIAQRDRIDEVQAVIEDAIHSILID